MIIVLTSAMLAQPSQQPCADRALQSGKTLIEIVMNFALYYSTKRQIEQTKPDLNRHFMFGQEKLTTYPGPLKMQYAIFSPSVSQIKLNLQVDRNMFGRQPGFFQAQLVFSRNVDLTHSNEFNRV